jgi:hypothetical protein
MKEQLGKMIEEEEEKRKVESGRKEKCRKEEK